MIEIEPQALITAAVGAVSTLGGMLAGRRMGRANASKVDAEALAIAAAGAYASIIGTHEQLRAGMAAEMDRLTQKSAEREAACATKIAALESRVVQLEADNSALRVELLGRELIDTDDLAREPP